MDKNYFSHANEFFILSYFIINKNTYMDSSLALAIILTFVGIIIFILISKNDLGVTTLKKDPESHSTLIGSISAGIPGSDILSSKSVPNTGESKENAVHN